MASESKESKPSVVPREWSWAARPPSPVSFWSKPEEKHVVTRAPIQRDTSPYWDRLCMGSYD